METVIQYAVYLIILVALGIPLGAYMGKVMNGEKVFLSRILGPCERLFYRVMHVKSDEQMTAKNML